MRNIKTAVTGKYLPEKVVTSAEIDEQLGLEIGWSEKNRCKAASLCKWANRFGHGGNNI